MYKLRLYINKLKVTVVKLMFYTMSRKLYPIFFFIKTFIFYFITFLCVKYNKMFFFRI